MAILNKLVFPIKPNREFVSGGVPTGKLTANDRNKDLIYVVSGAVAQSIITANFQNKLQNEDAVSVYMELVDIPVSELVGEHESYYELVKDWRVWTCPIPAKALEYVSYNRGGEVGISFSFQEIINPPVSNFIANITTTDFVPVEDGDYIVEIPEYSFDGKNFTYKDRLTKVGTYISRYSAIVPRGNTTTEEFSVDPSVRGVKFEEVEASITDVLIAMIGNNKGDIVDIKSDIVDIKLEDIGQNTKIGDLQVLTNRLDSENDIEKQDIIDLQNNKADTSYVDSQDLMLDNKINANIVDIGDLQADKVDRTQKIIGIDLQNDISLPEFKIALGKATTTLDGLMSKEDKAHLDTLTDMLANGDSNIVDTIHEILEVFENYPQGADLAQLLAGKVDKVSGKGLSTNDFTNNDKNKLDGIETGAEVNPYSKKQLDNMFDTTAKLAVSNVFTQPQQVPSAIAPQHATNKLQVETMFEMFKQQLRGYNIPPNLSNAIDLGGGNYRIYDNRGITVDYEVQSGIITLNGTSIGSTTVILFNIEQDTQYTLSFIAVSGTFTGGSFNFLMVSPYNVLINMTDNIDTQRTFTTTTQNELAFDMGAGRAFTNLQFKLQLEKGDTATPYTVPGQIPQYKIVGEE